MVFAKRYQWRLGVLLASALATASSCAEEQSSLIVVGVTGLSTEDETGLCVPVENTVLSRGVLDASFGTPYLLAVELRNQLQPQMNNNSGIDNSEIQLRDVDVKMSLPQAPEVLEAVAARDENLVEFFLPLPTNSLPAQSSTVIPVEVVPANTTAALAEEMAAQLASGTQVTLVVELEFHGERTGGSVGELGVVDARTYSFPIDLCLGCLVSCSTCPGGVCPVEASDYVGGVCGNAQDQPLRPSGCVGDQ